MNRSIIWKGLIIIEEPPLPFWYQCSFLFTYALEWGFPLFLFLMSVIYFENLLFSLSLSLSKRSPAKICMYIVLKFGFCHLQVVFGRISNYIFPAVLPFFFCRRVWVYIFLFCSSPGKNLFSKLGYLCI